MQGLIIVGLAVAAYFVGSFPTGYLLTRLLTGLDIREQGSGSTGATNVLRTVGKGAAAAVLVIDAIKGAIAVLLVFGVGRLTPSLPPDWQPWLATAAGLLALIGHSRSVWLQFKGGKSVATSIGILFVMSPLVALGTLGVFGITLALSRIVSLGSVLGAIAVSIWMVVFGQPLPYILFGVMAGLYVLVRHRANIQRILAGTEPVIGQKLQTDPPTHPSP
ncbi:MAG: glycerol-3-phosphate 1-O-acyltransferase [Spirulina sp. DLM2.Bin59]|nr:MAG: glycerol-3-phosphate 1-O-acyltransferase [Spirulina sp. DLM2.Bin59]